MDPPRHLLLQTSLLAVRRGLRRITALQHRERERLRLEIGRTRGLMALLMKERNGAAWSKEERRLLREHLRKLGALSPYLALLIAPGGMLLLPFVAWWLDRRNRHRPPSDQ